jgi:hypothetical protein
MARQRYFNTKFWDDNYIIDLDPVEKLLYLYFLLNPLTNIAGVYEISLRRISFDTGLNIDMINKIITRFSRDKKIYYHDGCIIICNFIKHQQYEKSPKIKTGIEIILNRLPDSLKKFLSTIPYIYPMNYNNVNVNNNSNTNFGRVKKRKKKKSQFDAKAKKKPTKKEMEKIKKENAEKLKKLKENK